MTDYGMEITMLDAKKNREEFYSVGEIPLSNIQLDTENLRYEPGLLGNQTDCINAILNDTRAKVLNLAENILQKPFYPDPVVLWKEDDKKWIVREGNRRITALKLLNNPDICENATAKSKLEKMIAEAEYPIPTSIKGTTHDDEDIMWDYIRTRHIGADEGRGLISWRAFEQDNLNVKLGRSVRQPLSRQLIALYKQNGGTVSNKFPVTTLERMLADSDFLVKVGLRKDKNVLYFSHTPKEVLPIIQTIIESLDNKEINVKDVYYKTDRAEFVEELSSYFGHELPKNELVKNVSLDQYKATKTDVASPPMSQPKGKKKSHNNKILKSKKVQDELNKLVSDKLGGLYKSLCAISLKEHPQLMYVGSWSFFESLANCLGKNSSSDFVSYLIKKAGNLDFAKVHKKDFQGRLKDILEKGNANKHSGKAASLCAIQLRNDFEVLEPLIIACLKILVDEKQKT